MKRFTLPRTQGTTLRRQQDAHAAFAATLTLKTPQAHAPLQAHAAAAHLLPGRSFVWLTAVALALATLLFWAGPARAQECTSAACLSSAGHLAELDSTDSELLDPLLGALVGQNSALGLTAADYDALANAQLTLGDLLPQLELILGVATPEEVLQANLTLPQLIDALDAVLPANAGISALQALPDIPGTIVLGDLLQLSSSPASLGNVNLNVLDLLVGSIQLFNYSNAVALQAIALDGAALTALGLPAQGIEGVALRAAVLEPPQIVCGPAGSQFRSANIRLALDADLTLASQTLTDLTVTVPGLTSVTASPTITLAALSLYIDVAGGHGVIQSIDTLAPSAAISVTPSIARIYLGNTAAVGDFFASDFDPATDVISATIGELASAVEVCLAAVCPTIGVTSLIQARSTAAGSSGTQLRTFSGPFPETHVFTTTTSSIPTLVSELLDNLEVDVDLAITSGSLPPAILTALGGTPDLLLNGIENDLAAPLTAALGSGLIQDEVSDLLVIVADPLLDTLGVGIGASRVTLSGVNGDSVFVVCGPLLTVAVSHAPDPLKVNIPGVVAVTVLNDPNAGATTGPITVTLLLPANLTFVSHTPAAWQRIGAGVAPYTFVYAPGLAAGAATTLSLHVTPTAVGAASITGAVVTPGQASTPFSYSTPVTAVDPALPTDSDGDGIPDVDECPGGVGACADSDGDGLPNHQDVDDDGDGIHTNVECPLGAACADHDGDGTPDWRDADDDGDGVYTVVECPSGRTTQASAPCPNSDSDTSPDYLDSDDDNDGLATPAECPAGRINLAAPACPDSDGDGAADYVDAIDDRIPPGQDTDGDGVPDQVECPSGLSTCPDSDDDATPDHQDADDDGDGIGTIVECAGGPPCPDSDGDGLPDHRDADDDNDGVYTVVECVAGRPTNAAPACPNTDGDANPNYLDGDDDGDGAPTEVECPAGRMLVSAPRCPAVGDPDLEDYLNPAFVLHGVQFQPIIFRAESVGPAGE